MFLFASRRIKIVSNYFSPSDLLCFYQNNTFNMRFAMYIVMLLVAICALFADTHALPKHRPRLPSGPGYGPFNPRQSWPVPLPNVSILINIYVIFGYAEYLIFHS